MKNGFDIDGAEVNGNESMEVAPNDDVVDKLHPIIYSDFLDPEFPILKMTL